MIWRVVHWVGRLGLGALFLYAGYTKLRSPFLFEMAVDGYQLLPADAVIVVARVLPWLEVALGLWLLAGWKLHYSATSTASLLGLFMVAMGVTYARGIEADCGCFGLGEPITPATLARDSLLFALAVFLAIYAWRREATGSTAAPPLPERSVS